MAIPNLAPGYLEQIAQNRATLQNAREQRAHDTSERNGAFWQQLGANVLLAGLKAGSEFGQAAQKNYYDLPLHGLVPEDPVAPAVADAPPAAPPSVPLDAVLGSVARARAEEPETRGVVEPRVEQEVSSVLVGQAKDGSGGRRPAEGPVRQSPELYQFWGAPSRPELPPAEEPVSRRPMRDAPETSAPSYPVKPWNPSVREAAPAPERASSSSSSGPVLLAEEDWRNDPTLKGKSPERVARLRRSRAEMAKLHADAALTASQATAAGATADSTNEANNQRALLAQQRRWAIEAKEAARLSPEGREAARVGRWKEALATVQKAQAQVGGSLSTGGVNTGVSMSGSGNRPLAAVAVVAGPDYEPRLIAPVAGQGRDARIWEYRDQASGVVTRYEVRYDSKRHAVIAVTARDYALKDGRMLPVGDAPVVDVERAGAPRRVSGGVRAPNDSGRPDVGLGAVRSGDSSSAPAGVGTVAPAGGGMVFDDRQGFRKPIAEMTTAEIRKAIPWVNGSNWSGAVKVEQLNALQGQLAQLEVDEKAAAGVGSGKDVLGRQVAAAKKGDEGVLGPIRAAVDKARVYAPDQALIEKAAGAVPFAGMSGSSAFVTVGKGTQSIPRAAAEHVWRGGSVEDAPGGVDEAGVVELRKVKAARDTAVGKATSWQRSAQWDVIQPLTGDAAKAWLWEQARLGHVKMVDGRLQPTPEQAQAAMQFVRDELLKAGLPAAPPAGYLPAAERQKTSSEAGSRRKLDDVALRIDSLHVSPREKMRMLERIKAHMG